MQTTYAEALAIGLPKAAQGWDIPTGVNPILQAHSGEMVLPRGGSWRAATLEEEEEVTIEGQATNAEETSVDETDAGSPDGSGDVGGDSGGDAGGGDGGGYGGDGGGE